MRILAIIALVLLPLELAVAVANPLQFPEVRSAFEGFISAVTTIGAMGLVVAVVGVGFLFIAAQGDQKRLQLAKHAALLVGIGGVIILGLRAIYQLVGDTIAGLSAISVLVILAAFLGYILFRKL